MVREAVRAGDPKISRRGPRERQLGQSSPEDNEMHGPNHAEPWRVAWWGWGGERALRAGGRRGGLARLGNTLCLLRCFHLKFSHPPPRGRGSLARSPIPIIRPAVCAS